jgi:hypothetical protein
LGRLLGHLREGDVATVKRLDRLARSTRDLVEIAERIKDAGAGLRSLAEPWADTTAPAGRMVLTVFAGMSTSSGRTQPNINLTASSNAEVFAAPGDTVTASGAAMHSVATAALGAARRQEKVRFRERVQQELNSRPEKCASGGLQPGHAQV